MPDTPTKARVKKQAAAAVAAMASSKVMKRLAVVADDLMVRAGTAAKRRRRARATKAALKTAGKIALVASTAGAAVIAGRSMMRKRVAAKSP